MDLSYLWNNSSKTAIIQNKEGDLLVIKKNSQQAYKNEQKIDMDVAAQVKDGRVFVPLRFVTETLGYHVYYESIREMVFIKSKDYTFNMEALNQDRDEEDKTPKSVQTYEQEMVAERRTAISLPINVNFEPLESEHDYHEYIFLDEDRTKYIYYNGNIGTVVKIENGEAVAQGQFDFGKEEHDEFDQIAGKITKNRTHNPLLLPYFGMKDGIVGFKENRGEGTMTAYYEYERGTMYDTIPFDGDHTNLIQIIRDLDLEGPKKYRDYINNSVIRRISP